MDTINISIAKDFSKTPGPRYIKEGPYSGELFRKEVLDPAFSEALKGNSSITINLDGAVGYGTSFLEEAFGGLARKFGKEEVLNRIEIISNEEEYLIQDIKEYINEADK